MNRHTENSRLLLISLLVVPVILGCIRYLDEPLANGIMRVIRSSRFLLQVTTNIPDTLLALVCIATVGMWFAYFFFSRLGTSEHKLEFMQVVASALPVAYLLKTLLQFVFGRTNTRLWLNGGAPLEFNLFHGTRIGGFPSGHMTVFTSLLVAVCLYYPSQRLLAIGLLLLLGISLVVTDYHFLSDVLAGAYLGLLVIHSIRRFLVSRPLVKQG